MAPHDSIPILLIDPIPYRFSYRFSLGEKISTNVFVCIKSLEYLIRRTLKKTDEVVDRGVIKSEIILITHNFSVVRSIWFKVKNINTDEKV